MKAKKKKIDKVSPKDLGVDISPRIEVISNLFWYMCGFVSNGNVCITSNNEQIETIFPFHQMLNQKSNADKTDK
jgi:hypothetical protein